MRPNLVVVTWTPRKLLSANKFEGRRTAGNRTPKGIGDLVPLAAEW